MNTQTTSLDAIKDIRKMMEKSSRFISLSGWSGIAAGICALAGAWFAKRILAQYTFDSSEYVFLENNLIWALILLAVAVFAAAFISAFLFTYIRSKKDGTPIWGTTSRRLLWNTMLPMIVGGIVILHLLSIGSFLLIAPFTLIFYGLGLVNGSKFTLGEVKYIGYTEIVLGLIALQYPGQGLLFWTIGFGVMHIVYGIIMWWKYERKSA